MPTAELRYVANCKSNAGHWHLIGEVYDHQRFENGVIVTTSRVEGYKKEGEYFYFVTKHTVYMVNRNELTSMFNYDMLDEVEKEN